VQGELRQDRWEKDGQQRSKLVIAAATIRPLGPPPQGSGDANARKYAPEANAQKPESYNVPIPPGVDEFTDDIPF
jgi:single-strand DNA-binding protein